MRAQADLLNLLDATAGDDRGAGPANARRRGGDALEFVDRT